MMTPCVLWMICDMWRTRMPISVIGCAYLQQSMLNTGNKHRLECCCCCWSELNIAIVHDNYTLIIICDRIKTSNHWQGAILHHHHPIFVFFGLFFIICLSYRGSPCAKFMDPSTFLPNHLQLEYSSIAAYIPCDWNSAWKIIRRPTWKRR